MSRVRRPSRKSTQQLSEHLLLVATSALALCTGVRLPTIPCPVTLQARIFLLELLNYLLMPVNKLVLALADLGSLSLNLLPEVFLCLHILVQALDLHFEPLDLLQHGPGRRILQLCNVGLLSGDRVLVGGDEGLKAARLDLLGAGAGIEVAVVSRRALLLALCAPQLSLQVGDLLVLRLALFEEVDGSRFEKVHVKVLWFSAVNQSSIELIAIRLGIIKEELAQRVTLRRAFKDAPESLHQRESGHALASLNTVLFEFGELGPDVFDSLVTTKVLCEGAELAQPDELVFKSRRVGILVDEREILRKVDRLDVQIKDLMVTLPSCASFQLPLRAFWKCSGERAATFL